MTMKTIALKKGHFCKGMVLKVEVLVLVLVVKVSVSVLVDKVSVLVLVLWAKILALVTVRINQIV